MIVCLIVCAQVERKSVKRICMRVSSIMSKRRVKCASQAYSDSKSQKSSTMMFARRALRSTVRTVSACQMSTSKLCVDQLPTSSLSGKRVFVRADLNVPYSKDDPGVISDDTRVRGAIPTLAHLTSAGARVVLASHLGRPKGEVNEGMRLTPVAGCLMKLLPGVKVRSV